MILQSREYKSFKGTENLNDNKQAVERSIKRIEQIYTKKLTEKEINRYKELQDLIKTTDSIDKLNQKSLSLKILGS